MDIVKKALSIQGAFELTFSVYEDDRGEFSRIYCSEQLAEVVGAELKQVNLSTSFQKGTLRGLHWQVPPHSETKVIQCINGSVFDVIVDLRKGSDTYLSWISVELSKGKRNAVVIPEGCAHGFQALTNNVQMIYYHTSNFYAGADRTANYASKVLDITWPLHVSIISEKDSKAESITSNFMGYKE